MINNGKYEKKVIELSKKSMKNAIDFLERELDDLFLKNKNSEVNKMKYDMAKKDFFPKFLLDVFLEKYKEIICSPYKIEIFPGKNDVIRNNNIIYIITKENQKLFLRFDDYVERKFEIINDDNIKMIDFNNLDEKNIKQILIEK
ncbi:MAG: hypothetical protein M0Q02_05425 [Candidatus Muirbacterium halophilum]|nr:hypothetical protein [Candidatus Muirbacterium halophilum]